jgi:hypothetical protein
VAVLDSDGASPSDRKACRIYADRLKRLPWSAKSVDFPPGPREPRSRGLRPLGSSSLMDMLAVHADHVGVPLPAERRVGRGRRRLLTVIPGVGDLSSRKRCAITRSRRRRWTGRS